MVHSLVLFELEKSLSIYFRGLARHCHNGSFVRISHGQMFRVALFPAQARGLGLHQEKLRGFNQVSRYWDRSRATVNNWRQKRSLQEVSVSQLTNNVASFEPLDLDFSGVNRPLWSAVKACIVCFRSLILSTTKCIEAATLLKMFNFETACLKSPSVFLHQHVCLSRTQKDKDVARVADHDFGASMRDILRRFRKVE